MSAGDALAAALLPAGASNARRAERILMVGAPGRLGEAVLIALLGASHIEHVQVATTAVLPSSEAKLSFIERSRLDELPKGDIDCAVILLGRAEGTFAASFYGRDKVFACIEQDELLSICEDLHRQGVQRLVLVSPTPFHLQSELLDRMVAGDTELQLVRWFESLTVLRPGQPPRPTASRSILQRFVRGYFMQLVIMLPAHRLRSHPKQVGILVSEAVRAARPGVAVLDSSMTASPGGALRQPSALIRGVPHE